MIITFFFSHLHFRLVYCHEDRVEFRVADSTADKFHEFNRHPEYGPAGRRAHGLRRLFQLIRDPGFVQDDEHLHHHNQVLQSEILQLEALRRNRPDGAIKGEGLLQEGDRQYVGRRDLCKQHRRSAHEGAARV